MCKVIVTALLQKELTEIARDQASGVTVSVMSEDNLCKLQGCLKGAHPLFILSIRHADDELFLNLGIPFRAGPDNSPYAGGTFLVDIELNNQYPYTPPKMKFITKVGISLCCDCTQMPPIDQVPTFRPRCCVRSNPDLVGAV